MSTSPNPNDLTRQQLDELDSLLQRMLSLPLSKPEPTVSYPPPPPLPELPPPSRPAPNWRADTPATTAKAPYIAPVPEPAPEPVVHAVPGPSPQPESFVARLHTPPAPTPVVEYAQPATGTLRGVDAPALPFDYQAKSEPEPEPEAAAIPSAFTGMKFAEVNPFADMAAQAADTPTPTPTQNTPSIPVVLMPLVAINWVLEFVLGWFGPIGHWLTQPATKKVLGWAGVALLAGAGVWAARGMGWVSWPR